MTRAEMLSELKIVLRETTYDAAWGDSLLLSYLAEGQDKFCEDTGYFIDATNYSVTTEVGVASYDLDERIIQVMDVFYGSTRLGKIQESYAKELDPTDAFNYPTEVGDSYAWQTDFETGRIKLYPVPTSVRELSLRVHRYSRFPLNGNDNGAPPAPAEPEIPARFHRAPIHWAAFRALTHHDMEQQDKVKAADHLEIYKGIMREGRTAFERITRRAVGVTPNPTYVV